MAGYTVYHVYAVSHATSEGLRTEFPWVPNLGGVHEPPEEFLHRCDVDNEMVRVETPSQRRVKRPRSPYSDDPERNRTSIWICLPPESLRDRNEKRGRSPEDDHDELEPPNFGICMSPEHSSDSDEDIVDYFDMDTISEDLSAKTRLSPDAVGRRKQHRRLLRHVSRCNGGPGPRWRMPESEQLFYHSLDWMRRAPDCEFMIPGYVNLRTTEADRDNGMESFLDRGVVPALWMIASITLLDIVYQYMWPLNNQRCI